MAKITFIAKDGTETTGEANGGSVMELAKELDITGIDGECGGVCSCATCHVHVSEEHFAKVGQANEIEADMLELDDNTNEFSRLGCQITIDESLDGTVFHVAND